MHFKHVCIEVIEYELAPNRMTSDALEDQLAEPMQRFNIPRGRLESLTGIRERRFWDAGTMPSDVATIAARRVIERSGVDPNAIGALINTSVCRDYIEPSTACLVHGNLKLSPRCLNYDIANACLGFLNGIATLGMMIDAGWITYGLVVDGEGSQEAVTATIRRLLKPEATAQDFRDSFATLTLGSGAVAMLLCHERVSQTGHRVNGQVTLAATQYNRLCLGQPDWMRTDAHALLVAGVQLATETWRSASEELPNWSDEQIDLYAPHQVSASHMSAIARALGITPSKMFLNYMTLGNIGPAALPITLAQAIESGRVQPGHHIGLMGIGSGLNCSMMSVTW